jgi:hypothetical protein
LTASSCGYEELEIELDAFHQLRVGGETIAVALTAQRELRHTVSIAYRSLTS